MLMFTIVGLGGCASVPDGPSSFDISPGEYARTFEAAKAALIDAQFRLDRVDARAGVISTQPRRSVGFVRPWDTQQSTPAQEFEEALHTQQRIVRITIGSVPAEEGEQGTQAAPPAPPTDLRSIDGRLLGTVRVLVVRQHRPGWRADPSGIALAGSSQNTMLIERGMWPTYAVTTRRDMALERRLAESIRRRASAG